MGQCRESGEDASSNADRNPEKLGSNMDRRPKAGGLYWTPISKDEGLINVTPRDNSKSDFTIVPRSDIDQCHPTETIVKNSLFSERV